MIFAAVLLIAIIVITLSIVRRRPLADRPPGLGAGTAHVTSGAVSVIPAYIEALLTRWSTAGLLTEQQAEKIRGFERAAIELEPAQARPSRVQAIAEAVGYLGGMLGMGGIVVLLARFWSDFDDPIRLGIPAVSTTMFIVSGFVVPEIRSPMMWRLRHFLWSLGTVTSAVTGWVFADLVLDATELRQKWLAVGVMTALINAALWAGKNRPVQQFMTVAGTAIAIGTFVGGFASAGTSGLVLWVASAALVGLSSGRPGVGATVRVLAGSITGVVGAYLTVATWKGPGLIFVLLTATALIAPAVVAKSHVSAPRELIMGIIGIVTMVQATPMSLVHFAEQAGMVTGLTVWGSGLFLLGLVALRVVRLGRVLSLCAGAMLIGGAAVTGAQSIGFATTFGLLSAIALIVIGARPGSAVMSVFGLIGLLVFIPWSISHFFPGEGRVPLLIIVSGLVLVGVAVGLTRIGGRLRGELGHARD